MPLVVVWLKVIKFVCIDVVAGSAFFILTFEPNGKAVLRSWGEFFSDTKDDVIAFGRVVKVTIVL